MKEQKEVKLVLELTEGYEKRFTEACCRALARRRRRLSATETAAGTAGEAYQNENNRHVC